jgi:hypothetical protein
MSHMYRLDTPTDGPNQRHLSPAIATKVHRQQPNIMTTEYYPYSRRFLLDLIFRVRLSQSHSLSFFEPIAMQLPSASWCVGASFASMRRGRIVRQYRILVSIIEGFEGMLGTTFLELRFSEDARKVVDVMEDGMEGLFVERRLDQRCEDL